MPPTETQSAQLLPQPLRLLHARAAKARAQKEKLSVSQSSGRLGADVHVLQLLLPRVSLLFFQAEEAEAWIKQKRASKAYL